MKKQFNYISAIVLLVCMLILPLNLWAADIGEDIWTDGTGQVEEIVSESFEISTDIVNQSDSFSDGGSNEEENDLTTGTMEEEVLDEIQEIVVGSTDSMADSGTEEFGQEVQDVDAAANAEEIEADVQNSELEDITLEYTNEAYLASNNSFSNATTIKTNTTYTDNLVSDSDVNYYKFTITSAGYVSLSFKHGYADYSGRCWEIYLYNSSSKELMVRSYVGASTAENISTKIGLPAGTYYVRVNPHYYSVVSYSLKVNYVSTSGWEKEFNDTFATANKISTGSVVRGSLMESDDYDYYQFTTTSVGYVSLSFAHDYADYSGRCWKVSLYNSSSEELMYRSYVGDTTAENTSTKIGLPAGTYYVKVNCYYHEDVPYSLKVNYVSTSEWEKEFNDTFATANKISTGSVVRGSLMEPDDYDYYQFTTASAGYVSLKFAHDYAEYSGRCWEVYLYNSNSEELMYRSYVGNSTTKSTSTKVGLPAGTYYIKVTPYYHEDVPYSLKVNYAADSRWETEFNDKVSTANSLTIGTKKYGSLMDSSDVDYYKFNVSSTGYYKLKFNHNSVNSSSTYWNVYLYNSSMSLINIYSYVGNVTSKTEGKIKLAKGTYYVKVEGYYYSDKIYAVTVLKHSIAAPTVSSISNTSTGVKVGWKAVSGASGYYVYRKIGSESWKKVKTTASTSWTDTGAKTNGTKYQYMIYSYDDVIKSSASATKTIYYLSRSSISSVKNSSSKKMTVTWSKNSKVTGYQIMYVTGSTSKTVTVSGYKNVSKVISSLTKGKTYKVYVRSYKTVSGTKYYSAWSSAKSIKITK